MTVVVAHQRRRWEADALARLTCARVFMDNGFLGEWKNTRRALEWGRSQAATHVIVLQDDAQPILNFVEHTRAAIRRRPDSVIGLYVGTGRPHAPEVLGAVQEARRRHASWLVADGLIWGVGSIWPVGCVNDFLCWNDIWRHQLPYDQRARAWSQAKGLRCYHTWPSLVNHADTPSVIKGRDHKLELVRVAHEVGVPDWNNVEVNMLSEPTLRP